MKYHNINAECARAGMSKAALASAMGVSPDIVKNWLSGKTEIPVSKVVALASLFNVTTDYLLGRTSIPISGIAKPPIKAKGDHNMDKCIIKSANKPCGNCLIRVNSSTWRRVNDLSTKAGRTITSVASDLLEFALARAEIEYTYREDATAEPSEEQSED